MYFQSDMELSIDKSNQKQILYVQTQPYVKIEFKLIRRAFKEKNLGRNERDLYRAMAYFVEDLNSDEVSCSIPELCEETQMSDKPLKKALKSLQEKSFISKLSTARNKGKYRLNIGIFYGMREKQGLVDNSSSLGVDLPLALGVDLPLPHVRAFNSSTHEDTNKQQQRVVVHFQFIEGSIFKQLKLEWLERLTKKYKSEQIQKVITRLEETYKKMPQVKTSLESLIIFSLKDPNFDLETENQRRDREGVIKAEENAQIAKQNDVEWEQNKKLETEKHQEMLETIKNNHPQILANAKFQIREEQRGKKQIPELIQMQIEYRTIAKYKQMMGWL